MAARLSVKEKGAKKGPNPFQHIMDRAAAKKAAEQRDELMKKVVTTWSRKKDNPRTSLQRALQRARRSISARREQSERDRVEAMEQHQRRLGEDPRYRLRYQMSHIYQVGDSVEIVMAKIRSIRQTFEEIMAGGVLDINDFYVLFSSDLNGFIQHMAELLSDRKGVIFTGVQVREIQDLLDLVADNSQGRIDRIAVELVGPDQDAGRLAHERRIARVDDEKVDEISGLIMSFGSDVHVELIRQLCADFPFANNDEIVERYMQMDRLLHEEYRVEVVDDDFDALYGGAAVPAAAAAFDPREQQVAHQLGDFGMNVNMGQVQLLCREYPGATVDFIIQRYVDRFTGKRRAHKHRARKHTHKRRARKHTHKRRAHKW